MKTILTSSRAVQETLESNSALRPHLTANSPLQLLNEYQPPAAPAPAHRIHRMFEAQVDRAPQRIAVMHEGEQLSYGELNQRANQLARHLRAMGVSPDKRVAVAMPRAPEMLVAILATLKAGGAYVPLDPSYPRERLAMMLDDAKPVALITNKASAGELPMPRSSVVYMDADSALLARQQTENLTDDVTPANLAYLIYTSGSTGKPKGVMVEHGALASFASVAAAAYEIGPEDRVLQFASISFDASAEEIYPCLIQGATLVLRSEAMLSSINNFIEQCAAWRISVLDLPTAYWHEMAEPLTIGRIELPASLRLIIIGGERALPDRITAWKRAAGDRLRLVNTYGPTETTVVATACDLSRCRDGEVPIGRALANTEIFILDADLQPVPIGDVGELHITGEGIARGYQNQPAMTATKFIPHPFAVAPGRRLYKTGDLTRSRPDGMIEFCGRTDNQVKIHGFRIEPGEIESAIAAHGAVSGCVVVAREVSPGDKQLIAYIVPAVNAGGRMSAQLAAELRAFLSDRLPHYMMPSTFITIDRLPISANGKIDRNALPDPGPGGAELRRAMVRPRDPLEHQLTQIWEEVFDRRPIGVTDSFFDLGGHSLLAMRMIDRIEQIFDRALPLTMFLAGTTIQDMAQALFDQEAANHCAPVVEIQRGDGRLPFYYLHGDFNGGGLYCRSLAQHLGSEQPFYALQPHGLAGQPAPASIEAMAEVHLRALRRAQPEGPYMLGGHCNGGLIAFEMARRLEAAGERVPLLALICTQGANTRFRGLYRLNHAICAWRQVAEDARQQRFLQWRERAIRLQESRDYYAERLRALIRPTIYAQATSMSRIAGQADGLQVSATGSQIAKASPAANEPGTSMTDMRQVIGHAYEQAMAAYVPRRYAGRVSLLWPEELPLETPGDATCGWRKAAAKVDVHIVPGGHLTCITKYVEPLAERLKLCLDRAQASC